MNDIFHWFGSDLSASPTGDLAPIDGAVRGQQRILRRLLTNPGDYIEHPDYGAGLPQEIGQTLDEPKIRALITGQMRLEAAVRQDVPPVITLQAIPSGISVDIGYVDAPSNTPQLLSFSVTN